MNERHFHGDNDRLRSEERLRRLQVDHVLDLCLKGIQVERVLDVGSGTGVFAEAFAARGLTVTGVDDDPGRLTAAQEYVPAADFHQMKAEEITFPDGSFDLVFLGSVLHEVDDAAQALREARRLATRRVAVLEWPYIQEEEGPPFEYRLSAERIAEMAGAAGLGELESVPLQHLVLYFFDL
jgi:ubiquinone/menaquinone biosynthesis C-methylase UbiE